jgi:FdhD protein
MKPLRQVAGKTPDTAAVLKAFDGLKAQQPMNQINKSTHAAGFCGFDGRVLLVREDIGRHNALDKLAGALARKGIKGNSGFLVLSSRLSVEMTQKTAAIGVSFVASISAPSALGLRLADKAGLKVACLAGNKMMIFDRIMIDG